MSIHRNHYTPFIDLDNQNNDQSDDDNVDIDNQGNNQQDADVFDLDNQNNDQSDDDNWDIDNQNNDQSDDDIVTNSFNDTKTNSFNDTNSHNDTDTNSNNDMNSHNDVDIDDAFNDNSQHYDTDLDVDIDSKIDDAFNDVDDSYNDNSDHYDYSQHFGEIDVNFENVFNGAFGGVGGAATGFALSQVADIVDNDTLSGVTQYNQGTFNAQAYADDASMESGGSGGGWGGHDFGPSSFMPGGGGSNPFVDAGGNANLVADASAHVSASAFNLDIVQGANLQQNAVDVSVVGGNMDNDVSDTSGDHF